MTAAIPIELRKIAYRQSAKDGLVITFACHPDDMPASLAAAPIGARFAAELVEIGDDEQPIERNKQDRRVQQAGILCNDKQFQSFMEEEYPLDWEEGAHYPINDRTAYVLRQACGVASRKHLAINQDAAAKFDALIAKFEMWKRGQ